MVYFHEFRSDGVLTAGLFSYFDSVVVLLHPMTRSFDKQTEEAVEQGRRRRQEGQ